MQISHFAKIMSSLRRLGIRLEYKSPKALFREYSGNSLPVVPVDLVVLFSFFSTIFSIVVCFSLERDMFGMSSGEQFL
jgi:hypothetical protein